MCSGSFQGSPALDSYRVDAVVEVDGTVYRRRRWVDKSVKGGDGLPWHFFRNDPVLVAAAPRRPDAGFPEGVDVGNQ